MCRLFSDEEPDQSSDNENVGAVAFAVGVQANVVEIEQSFDQSGMEKNDALSKTNYNAMVEAKSDANDDGGPLSDDVDDATKDALNDSVVFVGLVVSEDDEKDDSVIYVGEIKNEAVGNNDNNAIKNEGDEVKNEVDGQQLVNSLCTGMNAMVLQPVVEQGRHKISLYSKMPLQICKIL